MSTIIYILIALGGILSALYSVWRNRGVKADLKKKEEDMSKRMYELAILKDLGDRIGYSLNVKEIVDVITSSLHQFIDYSAVSYMLLEPEKIIFKVHLEKSVHRQFIVEVRDRMLGALGALLDRELNKNTVEEILSGSILNREGLEPVRSFFNIPVVIGGRVVAMITVADTKVGLYKEEEMTILYKITQQASNAVSRLQAVVQTEQAKLNAMVASMQDGVVMTDTEYRIVVINPAAKKVIGVAHDKDVTIFDFIDNMGGKIDIRGRLEESVTLQKPFVSDRVLVRDHFFQVFIFPVLSDDEIPALRRVIGGAVIIRDVTHEFELERVREDFMSMIVHELRTPLDAIKKMSEVLKQPATRVKKVTPDNNKEYVQLIYQNSSEMLELVSDILDLAKLEAGKFEIVPVSADFGETIANRVQFFNISARDAGIALKAEVSKDIPKAALFDPEAIKQVLNNLMSNALKFTKQGGSVTVAAFRHEPGQSLVSELAKLSLRFPAHFPDESLASLPASLVGVVIDTGVGVPEDMQGKLFNKFKQLKNKTVTTSIRGTGLGLAIAKGIVEEHKGKIGVVSQVDVGSAFYFVIPLQEVH
ncbi:GAF domain-containing protein [Candidatus Parcubacteria bacterium]|nr:GAF domain-containing protein [Candidatus Parcubacteria bacterium]